MNKLFKYALATGGSALALVGITLAAPAHAAGFVASSTELNSTFGGFATSVKDLILGLLTSGGVVEYMIYILLLGGILALVFWGISKIFKRRRV